MEAVSGEGRGAEETVLRPNEAAVFAERIKGIEQEVDKLYNDVTLVFNQFNHITWSNMKMLMDELQTLKTSKLEELAGYGLMFAQMLIHSYMKR
mmetsp:Transcript_9539/g.34958  ORF Transcript_9539/g.34958 Transcript_9539/m.34958 type:complete len:94 (+) Transcript_9539:177-458(+)